MHEGKGIAKRGNKCRGRMQRCDDNARDNAEPEKEIYITTAKREIESKEKKKIRGRVVGCLPTRIVEFVRPTAITSYSMLSHLLPLSFRHRGGSTSSRVLLLVEGNSPLCMELDNWGNGSKRM
jgi:hypothetical protein